MTIKGIDISNWQGSVDFKKVKSAGMSFVIPREGYGHTLDSRFKEYVSGAKAAGLKVLGIYHFIYVHTSTIKQNAEATVSNMKAAGLDPASTWVFADLEYDTWTKLGQKCTKEKCTAYLKEYCETLEKLGCKKVGIYLNLDYYRNYCDWSQLAAYKNKLWLADWAGGPDISCIIQQTSGTGKCDGINGNVDTDTVIDESIMKDDDNLPEPIPDPTPTPTPTPAPSPDEPVNLNLPEIKSGSKGCEVKTLQRILYARGIKDNANKVIAVDGEFGPSTKQALIKLQKELFSNDSKEWDGVCGEKTWQAMLTRLW